MNRRDFLLKSGAAVSLSFLSSSSLSAQISAPSAPPSKTVPVQQPAPVSEFKTLRRNVGTFTARGGTIGWLVNDGAVVGVDTQFPETAAIFLKDLPNRGARSFDAVINTHHHGDHTGGNATLRPSAKTIVAHANVPELMRARGAADNRPVDAAMIPDKTFTDAWRQDFGDETIALKYFGPAHTRGDIVTHFEKANVVHMGDLMFNRRYPVIDRPGGASIRAWVPLLERVAAEYPADAIYIFGHSNPNFPVTGTSADLLVFRDYLSALLAHVGKEIKAGKTKEEIVKLENMPGFPDLHAPVGRGNSFPVNLAVAYDELAST
ncbi:MBL fold metallo-hydrolase [Oleiharenicola lentus]|uniref:MBL fold metallo-hydrolase n=1 Tax=Oleiharenicola lentus TaxID=2508720 RepID=UPI003F68077C